MNNLKNKKILILGFSLTGVACAKYFAQNEANVFISEYNQESNKDKEKIEVLKSQNIKIEFGGHSEEFINNSDFCILSPSIPTDAPVLKRLEEKNIPYFSDIEFISKFTETMANAYVIPVTPEIPKNMKEEIDKYYGKHLLEKKEEEKK